jgi:hypothetical protein
MKSALSQQIQVRRTKTIVANQVLFKTKPGESSIAPSAEQTEFCECKISKCGC